MECSRILWIIDCALCLHTHPFAPSLSWKWRHSASPCSLRRLWLVTVVVWRRPTGGILAPPPMEVRLCWALLQLCRWCVSCLWFCVSEQREVCSTNRPDFHGKLWRENRCKCCNDKFQSILHHWFKCCFGSMQIKEFVPILSFSRSLLKCLTGRKIKDSLLNQLAFAEVF